MDILKPDLMWIQGTCYRINDLDSSKTALYNEEYNDDDEVDTCEPDEPSDEFDVEITEDGRFKTSFHIPQYYFSYLIGSRGSTRQRLENETKTKIHIPRKGVNSDITITGPTRTGVSSARRRVNLLVMTAKQKEPFTHFLSIPVTGESVKQGFQEFKSEVLEKCKSRGVDESIFQNPDKLHLTLGTMVLLDNEERKKAAEVLEECKIKIIRPLLEQEQLRLTLVGIEYMNDDPAEVDVLYGKVQLPGRQSQLLQQMADKVVGFFTSNDLMQKQYDQVKLHVTLMNTLFRNEKSGVTTGETSTRKRKPRESFDGACILKNYENHSFGEQIVDCIHLSQRYSTGQDNYYRVSTKINLVE